MEGLRTILVMFKNFLRIKNTTLYLCPLALKISKVSRLPKLPELCLLQDGFHQLPGLTRNIEALPVIYLIFSFSSGFSRNIQDTANRCIYLRFDSAFRRDCCKPRLQRFGKKSRLVKWTHMIFVIFSHTYNFGVNFSRWGGGCHLGKM